MKVDMTMAYDSVEWDFSFSDSLVDEFLVAILCLDSRECHYSLLLSQEKWPIAWVFSR